MTRRLRHSGPIRLCAAAVLATALETIPAACGQNEVEGRRVVGYFPEWGVYTADYHIPNLPPGQLTHVIYAFAQIDSNGCIAVYDEYAATEKFYEGDCWEPGCERGSFHQISLFKEQHPGTSFLIAVGGWTLSAPFYALAADAAKRAAFAQSCADFLARHPQFDGVDIDWEYPVVGGLERWGSPADAANFRLLLQSIRSAIGTNRLLTAAVSAGSASLAALDYPHMAEIVDWFNLMTYDFHGPWDARVGHNSPLYNNSDPVNAQLNLHSAVQALLARGVPATQIVPGIAFYGHSWRGVGSSNLYASASGPGPGTWEPGTLDYRDLAANYLGATGYVRFWDDIAKVPWLYHAGAQQWISYDDPDSVYLKGEYVRNHQLGGALAWELAADNGDLLDALRAGLRSPSFRLTALEIQGDNIWLSWTTSGGRTNVVEATDTFPDGFTGISPPIAVRGLGEVATNWIGPGGATGVGARFYRIRQLPD